MRKHSSFICVTTLLLAYGSLFAQTISVKPVSFVRTTKFKAGKASGTPLNQIVEEPEVDVTFDIPGITGNNSPARLPANFVPRPAGNPIGSGTFVGFNGLDQLLQAIAPTGFTNGQNGQLEPPDQGLAVGNGFVIEVINNALAIFDTQGNLFGLES